MKITPRPTVTKTTPVSTTTTLPATSTPAPPTTTLPPLPKATLPTSTPNASALSAKTWTKKAFEAPQLKPLPKPLATSPQALTTMLAPLLSADVATHHYDSFPFALQLLQHLNGKNDLVAAFRSFSPPPALAAWGEGGSNCVGHCASLVERLHAQGIPAAIAPVGHPDGVYPAHEPPYAHVAVVVPFVDAGARGFIVCDTGNNVAAPAVLFPGVSVTVPVGDGTRYYTYTLADDAKSVVLQRPMAKGGIETTTMTMREYVNPDASLTAAYAAMNPLSTLCARDDNGGVVASVVTDVENGVVRFSIGKHRTQLAFGDDLSAVVDDDFAKTLGTTAQALTQRLQTIIDGAPTLNTLRTALEGGAA